MKLLGILILISIVSCSKATVLKIDNGFRGLYCKCQEELVKGQGLKFDLVIPEEKLIEKHIIQKKANRYKMWLEIQSFPEETKYTHSGSMIVWKYQFKTVISEMSTGDIVKSEEGAGLSKEEDTWHDAIGEKKYILLDGDEMKIHCFRY